MKPTDINLPDELKAIDPVSSVVECCLLAHSITPSKDITRLDKYKIHLAKKYFKENLFNFKIEEIIQIFENPFFKSGLDGAFQNRALNYSIQNNVCFPMHFPAWFDKQNDNLRRKYFTLLNNSTYEIQIEEFCTKDTYNLEQFMRNNEPSFSLSLYAQKISPEYVFYNKTWSEQKLGKWFLDNEDKIKTIINHYFPLIYKISKTVNKAFINSLVEYFKKNEIEKDHWNNSIVLSLCVMPKEFWSKLEKECPGLIKEKLSVINEKNTTTYSLNVAQSLISNLLRNRGLKHLNDVFDEYLELGLAPIEENINGYIKKTDVFEIALRHELWHIFVPYSSHMNMLSETQKEIMCAASFSYFSKDGKDKDYTNWANKVLIESELKLVEKYYQSNLGVINNIDKLNEIETLIMAKKLKNQLEDKPSQARMKI